MEIINIAKTLYKVSDFLSWQRAGTLELSPNFQRRPVWQPSAKSYFVDTVARGLPVPIIFIREITDINSYEPKREIVDGQQRIRTLLSYIDHNCLPDYNPNRDYFQVKPTHNSDLANKEFNQLPIEIRRQILDYQFSSHILPSGTDDRLVLQIFARMNSTGVKLNGQELRNAQFFGVYKGAMYQLASEQLNRWRNWKIMSELNIARMAEVEFTSDLVLLITAAAFGMSQSILDRVYKDFDEDFPHQNEIERRFQTTMDSIDDTYGKEISKSVFNTRLLFYPLFACFYDRLFTIKSPLTKKTPAKLPSNLKEKINLLNEKIEQKDVLEEFALVLKSRDTNASTRRARFTFFQEYLK